MGAEQDETINCEIHVFPLEHYIGLKLSYKVEKHLMFLIQSKLN